MFGFFGVSVSGSCGSHSICYIRYGVYNKKMGRGDGFYIALGDRVRRRVLALLLQEEELCVCELAATLHLPQPKVSRHLAVLRNAGIVTMRRSGTWIFYRLSPHAPVWIYKTIELMAQGESADGTFVQDAARLKHRAVRHAEVDYLRRAGVCGTTCAERTSKNASRPR